MEIAGKVLLAAVGTPFILEACAALTYQERRIPDDSPEEKG